eukprot:456596_1
MFICVPPCDAKKNDKQCGCKHHICTPRMTNNADGESSTSKAMERRERVRLIQIKRTAEIKKEQEEKAALRKKKEESNIKYCESAVTRNEAITQRQVLMTEETGRAVKGKLIAQVMALWRANDTTFDLPFSRQFYIETLFTLKWNDPLFDPLSTLSNTLQITPSKETLELGLKIAFRGHAQAAQERQHAINGSNDHGDSNHNHNGHN